VNQGIHDLLQDKMPDSYTSTATISLVSGTATYDLPSDFGDINSNNTGLYIIKDGRKTKKFDEVEKFSNNDGVSYDFDNLQFTLYPTPTTAEDVTLIYSTEYTELTSLEEDILLPRPISLTKDFWVQWLSEFSAIDNDEGATLAMKQQMRVSAEKELMRKIDRNNNKILSFSLANV